MSAADCHDATNKHAEPRELTELTRRLRALRDPAALLAVLEKLEPILRDHFADEECDRGLFAELQALAPHNVPQVQVLISQHRQILTTLRALLSAAAPTAASASALAEAILDHVRDENLLLQDCYLVDHGGGA